MKLVVGLLAASTALCGLAASADAATFRPTGKYAFTSIDSCESKFGFTTESVRLANNNTNTAVHMITSQHNGHIGSGVGYITFTPKTASGGNFTFSLTNVHGGALRVNNGGVNVLTEQQSANGTYSFTATTFTLKPASATAMVFTMAYGALNSSGMPSSVHLVRQDSSGETTNCVQALTATK